MKVCFAWALVVGGLLGCRSAAPEGPGELIQVLFEGNAEIPSAELEEVALGEMLLFGDERPNKAAVDDAAYAIELFYRERGYREAEVSYRFDGSDSALVRADFVVREGQVTRVRALTFEGHERVAEEELVGFFGRAARGDVFVEREVQAGASKARDYYYDLGYRKVRIEVELKEEPEANSESGAPEEREVEVLIRVREGLRAVLDSVRFEGGEEGVISRAELLEGRIDEPYAPRVAFAIRSQLLDAHARAGYPRCEIELSSEEDPATGGIALTYGIEPGQRVVVASVRIEGNEHTRESLIRGYLPLGEGEVYDSDALQRGIRALYGTGLFESVRIDLTDDDALAIEVVESSSLELRLEPGWGSYEGPRVVVSLDERNFAGTGRRVNLKTHLSSLAYGTRLSFFDPQTLGPDVQASASVFQTHREEPSFTVEQVGLDLILQRPFGERVTGSVGYEFRVNELKDVDVRLPLVQTFEEPNVGLVSVGFLFDDRDDALLPRSGRRARGKLEYAQSGFGSEIDFLRARADTSWLGAVTENVGLAVSFRSVWILPLENDVEIPLQERAFNGGENSVRSFREDELGPRDAGGEPFGGEASTVLSAELRRDLGRNFAGALFFDAGNVTLESADYLHFEDFRFAVGLGIRYALPIGPLRLDLGFNPAARDREDDYVLHFSVGFPY